MNAMPLHQAPIHPQDGAHECSPQNEADERSAEQARTARLEAENRETLKALLGRDFSALSADDGAHLGGEWYGLFCASKEVSDLDDEDMARQMLSPTFDRLRVEVPLLETSRVLLAQIGRQGTNPFLADRATLEQYLLGWYATLVGFDPDELDWDISEIRALFMYFLRLGSPTAEGCLALLDDGIGARILDAAVAHDQAVAKGLVPADPWIRGGRSRRFRPR